MTQPIELQGWSWGDGREATSTQRKARMAAWDQTDDDHKTWVSVEMRFITLERVPGYPAPVLMGPGQVLASREAGARMKVAARSLGFRSLRQAIDLGCLVDVLSEAIEGEEAPCPACAERVRDHARARAMRKTDGRSRSGNHAGKRYTLATKQAAVDRLNAGENLQDVALSTGISEASLTKWQRHLAQTTGPSYAPPRQQNQ